MKKYYFILFLSFCFFLDAESQCSTGGAIWTSATDGIMNATGVIAGINIVQAGTVGTMTSGRPLYRTSGSTWKGLNFAALEVWRAYSLPGANYTYFKLQTPMDSNYIHLRVDNIRGDLFNWENQRIKGYNNGVPVPIVFKDPINGAFITGGNIINGASTTTSAIQSAMRAFFVSAVDSIVIQQASFSDWIIAQLMVQCDYILPVSVSSFTATDFNYMVRLEWKNALETDNLLLMEIERSFDGRQWTTLSSFVPRGQNQSYHFNDYSAIEGVNYYRIRFVFADGHFNYSSILHLNRANKKPFTFMVFPNPAKDQINISFNSGFLRASIFDQLGRRVSSLQALPGTQLIDCSQWQTGIYYLVAQLKNGEQFTMKIFRQ